MSLEVRCIYLLLYNKYVAPYWLLHKMMTFIHYLFTLIWGPTPFMRCMNPVLLSTLFPQIITLLLQGSEKLLQLVSNDSHTQNFGFSNVKGSEAEHNNSEYETSNLQGVPSVSAFVLVEIYITNCMSQKSLCLRAQCVLLLAASQAWLSVFSYNCRFFNFFIFFINRSWSHLENSRSLFTVEAKLMMVSVNVLF